jgi:hypothetical protein
MTVEGHDLGTTWPPAVQKLRLIPSTQRRRKRGGGTPFLNLFLYDVSVAAGGHVVPKSCPSSVI